MLSFLLSILQSDEEKNKMIDIYNKFKTAMYGRSFAYLKSKERAEDCIQDTFIHLIDHFDQIDDLDDKKNTSYIMIVFETTLYKNYHKFKVDNNIYDLNEIVISNEYNIEEKVETNISIEKLAYQIECLSDNYKLPLLLKYYNGFSYEEISNITGLSQANCRKIVQRAKNIINDNMEKEA